MWQGGYSLTVLCEELLPIVLIESDKGFFFLFFFIKGGNRHFLKKYYSLSVSLPVVFLNLLLTLSVEHHKIISKEIVHFNK